VLRAEVRLVELQHSTARLNAAESVLEILQQVYRYACLVRSCPRVRRAVWRYRQVMFTSPTQVMPVRRLPKKILYL
jgi:hypothetical protein